MRKITKVLTLALFCAATIAYADPILVPVSPIPSPNNPDNQRGPIALPMLYLDGYALTAAEYTLGSTIQLLDEDDNVVFSIYIYIEGNIQLPTTLSGTYTIRVIRDGQTFIGEITL